MLAHVAFQYGFIGLLPAVSLQVSFEARRFEKAFGADFTPVGERIRVLFAVKDDGVSVHKPESETKWMSTVQTYNSGLGLLFSTHLAIIFLALAVRGQMLFQIRIRGEGFVTFRTLKLLQLVMDLETQEHIRKQSTWFIYTCSFLTLFIWILRL